MHPGFCFFWRFVGVLWGQALFRELSGQAFLVLVSQDVSRYEAVIDSAQSGGMILSYPRYLRNARYEHASENHYAD